MQDPALTHTLWIVNTLSPLARILVWPIFIWFFTRRADIQQLLRDLVAREWRVKLPGASIKVLPPEAPKRLPTTEPERDLPTPPKPGPRSIR